MNRHAYLTTGLAIRTLSSLLKAKIKIHGREHIPPRGVIFVINHFTRIETLLLPTHIYGLTGVPVWSLADDTLFKGALAAFLDKVGAVSTADPHRDRLIVKSLLTGSAHWIIYPEGRMVKSKKTIDRGRFMVFYGAGKHPPHTGAATLALRTEFYRRRLRRLLQSDPPEAERLLALFQIESVEPVLQTRTHIVPVNITYYPIRAKENALSSMASRLVDGISERAIEEIMTEGTMLLSGVDVDIRFGPAMDIDGFLTDPAIEKDLNSAARIDFDDPIPSLPVMRKTALQMMRRYMAAIYQMTTVNHDHLFASMLKAHPFKRISEQDLRRRVFMAVTEDIGGVAHTHSSLHENQIHLLSDDRYSKYDDFISLALEKGCVLREGAMLRKDPRGFFSTLDFHRARVDSPVAVIANEVEPLKSLQRHIRRIAWRPSFWLKRTVARRLMAKALAEYDADYAAFFAEGESKDPEVGRPFLLKGGSRAMGVLLIHGYMAAPLEVKELADFLNRKGYWVYAPRLKGHGTSPEDLAVRSYHDWCLSVEEGYGVIRHLCRRVAVGGFSTGAGLALRLASFNAGIAGVFAVSAPLRLQDFSAKFAPAVNAWNRMMGKFHMEGARKTFVENRSENPHINYARNPVAGVREIERLMDAVEQQLASVNMPALVVQAAADPVVDRRGAQAIFDGLGSSDKQYMLFNFDRHGILLGPGSRRVHRIIADFLAGL